MNSMSVPRATLSRNLWHGRKIIVLCPDDFSQEMIGILKDMARSHGTGENTVEEYYFGKLLRTSSGNIISQSAVESGFSRRKRE